MKRPIAAVVGTGRGLPAHVCPPQHPKPADRELDEHDEQREGKSLCAYHGEIMIGVARSEGQRHPSSSDHPLTLRAELVEASIQLPAKAEPAEAGAQ